MLNKDELVQNAQDKLNKLTTKQIVCIVMVVLGLIIALQNLEPVTTKILFVDISLPHIILMLLVFGLGVFAGRTLKFEKWWKK